VSGPRFSILTPVYETPADVLRSMLGSVWRQTFADWELCLVDDGSRQPHVHEILDEAERHDPRIRVKHRETNGRIVQASNDALGMAQGEFIVLLDHDDELHRDALARVDEAIRGTPEADYVYSDEDKIGPDGRHWGAFFKPDWSPERLRTQMYTCHLSALRRSLVEDVGGFDAELEGSQDWDLVLKVTERARAVVHVPKVLYHWRALETSAAGGGVEAKPWAFEAGARAIEAHCARIGLPARAEHDGAYPGVYHLRPALEDHPKVSIVIPTGGQSYEVRYAPEILVLHCVRSIVETSTYESYEIVCVVDDSVDEPVLKALREIAGDRLRLVRFERPFSFSAKINLGTIRSKGEHLLLLNDDMEVVTPNWIERLVMYSEQPEIGAVGARLLNEDGRLQHAGVMFRQGRPGHIYKGFSRDFAGYGNNVLVANNYLAVTGACLMTRREVFKEVGGLTTLLPVNYNDVDYCLKQWSSGRRVVYDPDTVLYHFESASRPIEVAEWEIERIADRWLPLTAVDPFSNPNFPGGVIGPPPPSVREVLRAAGTRVRSSARQALARTG
jgi:GT2 family glycosyltransferase